MPDYSVTFMKFNGKHDESEKPLPVGVGGLLIRASGEICAISRKTNIHDLGLPGGKVDPGETEAEALKRGYWFVIFLVYNWEGDPYDAEKKGAMVRWVPPLRLIQPECSFREYNRDLFTYLGMMYEGAP